MPSEHFILRHTFPWRWMVALLLYGAHTKVSSLYVLSLLFNKKKIKLCYSMMTSSHTWSSESVCEILQYCFKYLPGQRMSIRVISLGLAELTCCILTPLCICLMRQSIRSWYCLPHTIYCQWWTLWWEAHPLTETFTDSAIIKWVQPVVDRICPHVDMTDFDTSKIQFMSKSEADRQRWRSMPLFGWCWSHWCMCYLMSLVIYTYQSVPDGDRNEGRSDGLIDHHWCSWLLLPDGRRVLGEGFVMSTEYGMIKLVDRTVFSHANMTQGRFAWELIKFVWFVALGSIVMGII